MLIFQLLLVWLRLSKGLSRRSLRTVATVFRIVLGLVGLIVTLASRASVPPLDAKVPLHENTLYSQLDLEPSIERRSCCPACYASYSIQNAPPKCTHCITPGVQPCNEPLDTWRHRRRQGPIKVPRAFYSTQDFEAWLTHFLGRPEVETLLEQSWNHVPSHDTMYGLWDSPAWTGFQNGWTSGRHHLTFSIYIDWFNPYGNKIGGKVVSCGAIMLVCMNLPPEHRFRLGNMFFAGMTPPPYSPNVTAINELTEPIICQLLTFWPGKVIPTFQHPNGVLVGVAILPVLADLPALRKLCGYLSFSATYFCTWCRCRQSDLERLDLENWEPRTAAEVRSAATTWHSMDYAAREAQASSTGVRWSPLHLLPYWDPVESLVLDYMHNFLEGVLQSQLHIFWAIGITKARVKSFVDYDKELHALEYEIPDDTSEIDDELASLRSDSQAHDEHLTASRLRARSVSDDSMEIGDFTAPNSSFSSVSSLPNDDTSTIRAESSHPSDRDYIDVEPQPAAEPTFSPAQIEMIRQAISDINLPSWVSRPPFNLGDAEHGSLSADELLILFEIIFPMKLPEIWLLNPGNVRNGLLLHNFADLVLSSNIVTSFKTSGTLADQYTTHFISFRQTRHQLWPNIASVPNDHLAMHNGRLLKHWGPFGALSTFNYETVNGILARVPTNRHSCELKLNLFKPIS